VNDEFSALNMFLRCLPNCLNPGGRVAILTFHSGEDRRVKKSFQAGLRASMYEKIARDVIRPTSQERRRILFKGSAGILKNIPAHMIIRLTSSSNRHVEVAVDVGEFAEVPDHLRPFDLPGVPDAVAGNEQAFDQLPVLDGLHRRRDIVRTEEGQQAAQGVAQLGLLVLTQIRAAETGQVRLPLFDDVCGTIGSGLAADQVLLPLFAVE
jgi:hypothetical protein